uniref:hypothetical protein n=1 Tax=Fannyhessea vaginae TaxID=82135 RepID=UPI0001E8EAFD
SEGCFNRFDFNGLGAPPSVHPEPGIELSIQKENKLNCFSFQSKLRSVYLAHMIADLDSLGSKKLTYKYLYKFEFA